MPFEDVGTKLRTSNFIYVLPLNVEFGLNRLNPCKCATYIPRNVSRMFLQETLSTLDENLVTRVFCWFSGLLAGALHIPDLWSHQTQCHNVYLWYTTNKTWTFDEQVEEIWDNYSVLNQTPFSDLVALSEKKNPIHPI